MGQANTSTNKQIIENIENIACHIFISKDQIHMCIMLNGKKYERQKVPHCRDVVVSIVSHQM